MSHRENIQRIKIVHNALEELGSEVVFVGGATVSLYIDRPGGDTRPTDDVDILIELSGYNDYAAIEEKLRSKGFQNDVASGIICRYIVQGIIVDIMPTSDKILGFANRWYPDAFVHAQTIAIEDDLRIKIFSPAYFIATKLEAYKGRGNNEGRTSTDFEDIVFVLNNRTTIWYELDEATDELGQYLRDAFTALLSQPYIEEWISAHLDYNEQGRTTYIIGGMNDFIKEG